MLLLQNIMLIIKSCDFGPMCEFIKLTLVENNMNFAFNNNVITCLYSAYPNNDQTQYGGSNESLCCWEHSFRLPDSETDPVGKKKMTSLLCRQLEIQWENARDLASIKHVQNTVPKPVITITDEKSLCL